MIDLHTHSRASDGSLSPGDLVAHAASAGITVLALTDHDTIDGLAEAAAAAPAAGIRFIPGIEVDIDWKPGEFHLLGYGVGNAGQALRDGMSALIGDRGRRNAEIVDLMRSDGLDIDMAAVEAIAGGGTVGRPHFARLLVERKYAKNVQQAFDRYLGMGRPYYIGRKSLSLETAIAAILECKGVPVLAHPMSLYLSRPRLTALLADFKDKGIAGIEAWHPGARVAECEFLEKLALSLGLFVTAGSDFHGAARPDRKIGHTAGSKKIEDRYFEDGLARFL